MSARSICVVATFALIATTEIAGVRLSEAASFTVETVDSAPLATVGSLQAKPTGGFVLTSGATGGAYASMISGSGTPFSGRIFESTGAAWQASASMPPTNVAFEHAMTLDGQGWRHFLSWQYPASDSSRPLLQDEGPGGWSSTVMDTSAVLGVGVAIDRHDQLWAAWMRVHRFNCCFGPPNELVIAHRTPQGWSQDSLPLPFVSYFTPFPLAVDGEDQPHVLFVGNDYHGLYHAVRTAGGWESTLLDSGTIKTQNGTPATPTLLTAPDGTVHALFRVGGVLRYAHLSAGAWQVESLPFSVSPNSMEALAIDKAGHPRIAFIGDNNGWSSLQVRYAYLSGAGWVVVPVCQPASSFWGRGLSLALDEFDRPTIAFPGPYTNQIAVATLDATTDVAPSTSPSGAAVSLALASSNPVGRNEAIRWSLSLQDAAGVTLEAFDLAGRRLASSGMWSVPQGESTLLWTPPTLPSGSLFVRARTLDGQSRAVQVFVRP